MKKYIIILFLAFNCVPIMAQVKTKAKVRLSSAAVAAVDGENVYTQYCTTCHQADGGGVPGLNPPLIKTSYVLGNKVRLIKVVLNGLAKKVDIDGRSYSNIMPAHDFLNDQEIAAVLTYVRKNFTNKASAISAVKVKAIRAANKK